MPLTDPQITAGEMQHQAQHPELSHSCIACAIPASQQQGEHKARGKLLITPVPPALRGVICYSNNNPGHLLCSFHLQVGFATVAVGSRQR